MQYPQPVNPLETALAALRPAASLERDRLLFQAGKMAGRRGRWIWPALTCLSTGAACWLGWLVVLGLAHQESPGLVQLPRVQTPPVVQTLQPHPPQVVETPPLAQRELSEPLDWPRPPYLQMQDQMVRGHLESGPALVGGTLPAPLADAPITAAGTRPRHQLVSTSSFFFSWWR